MPTGALALYRESRQILVSWRISVFSLCPVSHLHMGIWFFMIFWHLTCLVLASPGKKLAHNEIWQASSSIGLTEESTGSMQTANGATLLVNIGHVQRSQGNPDAALDTYKEARGLFKASGSWETPAGAACRSLIGVLSAWHVADNVAMCWLMLDSARDACFQESVRDCWNKTGKDR